MDCSRVSACGPPTRFWIGCMAFGACMITYLIQSNMSLAMLAMAQPTNATHADAVPDFGHRYPYTPYEQSSIIGAFYIGTAIGTFPVGLLVDRYNCVRLYILWSCALCALLLAAIPTMAGSVALLIVTRLVMGVAQGAVYPAVHKLFDSWAPPDELGKFTATLMGSSAGTICSWALSGVLIERFGWPAAFYGVAALTLAFCVAWWWLAFDAPAQHPRIGRAEREYIERSLVAVTTAAERADAWPPLGAILTSVPVWSLIVMQFGNLWGVSFVVTSVPRYMSEFLGFTVLTTGFVGSLPYLTRVLAASGFGLVADWLRRRGWMSLLNLRRVFSVIAQICPGLLLALIPFVGSRNPAVGVALLTASYALNGAVTQSVFANIHDLSPNFSGTIVAVANSIGSTTGFITPVVVTFFTAENNTIEGWRSVFLVGGSVYILPVIVFMFFGSASVQPWNRIHTATIVASQIQVLESEETTAETNRK